MSLDAYNWLLGDTPVTGRPPPNRPEFLGACAYALRSWRVLPHIAARIFAWSPRHAATPEADLLRDAVRAIELHAVIQLQLTRRLTSALDEAGIPHVLLKGAAARHVVWERPEQRGSWDIDLGVPEPWLPQAERVVRAQGYLPAVLDRTTMALCRISRLQRVFQETGHYELCPMAREMEVEDLDPQDAAAIRRVWVALGRLVWWEGDGVLLCRTGVDVHHGLVAGVPVDDVVRTRRRVDGWPVPTTAWMLAHLLLKLDFDAGVKAEASLWTLVDLGRLWARLEAEGGQAELTEVLAPYADRPLIRLALAGLVDQPEALAIAVMAEAERRFLEMRSTP